MTLIQPAWAKLLEPANYIGGDIEAYIAGVVTRGPLAEIIEDGDTVTFRQAWRAVQKKETKEWEYLSGTSILAVSKEMVVLKDMGQNKLGLRVPFCGDYEFFPRSGSQLPRRKVRGLPSNSVRLLALYPNLRFDRTRVREVCLKHSFRTVLLSPGVLSPQATLQTFLSKFSHDYVAEQFLWHYIEAMTGEPDAEHLIY